MSDDYLDIDSVLFGSSDPPADGSFDPFLPGLGQNEREDGGPNGATDDSGQPDSTDGVIRYGRFGGQSGGEFESDDDGPLLGSGGTATPTPGTDEQRDREQRDAGNNNIRRVAESRSGSTRAGETGRDGTPLVASSIASAQQRIRDIASLPITPDIDRAITAVAKPTRAGGERPKPKRTYERQTVLSPPQFQRAEFEATLMGLKSNVSGNWILQLLIPPSDSAAIFELKDAHSLALHVTVVRKRFAPDGDT